jgi:hypothetical protein
MKAILTTLGVMLFCTTAFTQGGTPQNSPQSTTPANLTQQYRNLKEDQEVINGFRMVKMYTMDRFWNVVEDSLRAKKAKYAETVAIIARQQTEIAGLNATLEKTEKEKLALASGVDNILVFGSPFPKGSVITVSIVIISALLVLAGFLFVVGRMSYYTTRELRKLNESIYQEYDNYKRSAVEKEIKILREMQNYRNKLSEAKLV